MMNTNTSLFVGWKLPFDEDLFEQLMEHEEIPFDCVVDRHNADYILIGEFEIDNFNFKIVPKYEDAAFSQRLQTYKQSLITEYGETFAELFSQAEHGSFVVNPNSGSYVDYSK